MDLSKGDISRIVFKPNVSQDMGQLKLSNTMINVLAALDGHRDVSEIASSLEMSLAEIRQILIKLYQGNLILLAREKEQVVSPRFFSLLKEHLAQYMGPVADMLISDAVEDLGEEKEQFPSRRALELVNRLAGEISSPDKKQEFHKGMKKIVEQTL